MAQSSVIGRIWYRLIQLSLQLLGVAVYGLRCSGRENIPAKGGVLVVSNHQSHFDPPMVGVGCTRQMNFVARKTLWRSTVLGWLMASLRAFPIDREGSGLVGIRESMRRLERGELVLIFPEGTRSPDGQMGHFHSGFATLAIRSRGAAILPVAIHGAFDVWPRRCRLPRFGTIHVHFGPPMLAEEIEQYDQQQLTEEIERRVRRCHALLRQHSAFAQHRVGGGFL